ncbi:MAG TPA: hypothetical protein VF432_19200 [Thermoanaerobaculia bacterium]
MHAPEFTYDYNASALGLGGVLKHRNGSTTIIPSLASVALAPTGGEGFNEISNYDKDGVSFSNARSSVMGYDSGHRTFTTRSDVYITNLDLFGRLKAAILQTSVSSTREVLREGDIRQQSNPDNARFSMQAMIRGLTIDGIEIIPELDLELCESATYEQFTNRIGGRGVDAYAKQFGVEKNDLQTVLRSQVQPIRASFVRDLQHKPTDKFGPRKGFKLPVKRFGHVHFGEMVVKPGRRRVNLLRIEFDSTLRFGERVPQGIGERVAQVIEEKVAQASALITDSVDLESADSPSPYKGFATIMSLDGNGAPSWP